MKILTFSEHVNSVFAACGTNYEMINNLMQDVALGREIYDAETDRVISKKEANEKIYNFSLKILGIENVRDKKQVRRGFRDHGKEWFDIIEDTVDTKIAWGFTDSMWFNDLVDQRNIAYGDRQDFYIEEEAILSVAKAGTSHHDHILQRLPSGSTISLPTALYTVSVGADINKYILGQVDWSSLVDAIATAFMVEIQKDIFAEVSVAATRLPVQTGFVGTGALSASTKAAFDDIIENVSTANDGAEVVIMGTKSALSKITAIGDVTYNGALIATAQKDNVMNTGNIGIYEGTRLIEIPNRFAKKLPLTGTNQPLPNKLFRSDLLSIVPVIGDAGKFVKFVDEGDTLILEKTERGDRTSDIMSYEVQRHFGVGTVIGRYFGQWTL